MMSLIWRSLSGRLLFLTVIFVMLAEILIFVPSIARYRQDFLVERLEKGQIAALAATEARHSMLTADLQAEVLKSAGLYSVVLMRGGQRQPMLMQAEGKMYQQTYDLREAAALELIGDALLVVLRREDRLIRVIDEIPKDRAIWSRWCWPSAISAKR